MKKLVLTVALLTMATTACAMEPMEFEWECNTDNPAGYKIHWSSTMGGPYSDVLDVGLPTPDADNKCYYTLAAPPARLNYYVATAYDVDGFNSDYSNEVDARSKHVAPGQLKRVN